MTKGHVSALRELVVYRGKGVRKRTAQGPLTEAWIKKMWYIYIYNGILLSHIKE